MESINAGLQSGWGVLVAIAPLVLVMVIVRWMDEYTDVPPLRTLSGTQKIWLCLRTLDPRLSAQVFAAWGEHLSWLYLQEASKMPPNTTKLAPKVLAEFCQEIRKRKAELNSSAEPADFMCQTYTDHAEELAADLNAVWGANLEDTSSEEEAPYADVSSKTELEFGGTAPSPDVAESTVNPQ
jgi:hypothetical protein